MNKTMQGIWDELQGKQFSSSEELGHFGQQVEEVVQACSDEELNLVAQVYDWVAHEYLRLGDEENGLRYYDGTLNVLNEVFGKEHPYYSGILVKIGKLCQEKDDERAIYLFNDARDIAEKTVGEDHPFTTEINECLGESYLTIGQTGMAMAHYTKAQVALEKNLGTDAFRTAQCYCKIGQINQIIEEYGDAALFYEKGLDILARKLGEEHKQLGYIYRSLGEVYSKQDKIVEGIEAYTKAYRSLSMGTGEDAILQALQQEIDRLTNL